MAGLLSDVLPFLYSQGDRAKRYLGGLLGDPIGSAQQTAGALSDAGRAQQGLLAQAFANQARPFQVTDQQALGQAAENVLAGPLGFAPVGMTAWHGSPHVFDKFDSSKIGTGEGAQAYGHGLYLAESPAVAKAYQDALASKKDFTLNGKPFDPPPGTADYDALAYVRSYGHKGGDEIAGTIRAYQKLKGHEEPIQRLMDLKANGLGVVRGSLYKVDLPDSAVAKMLDWDKPLSQQPESVKKALGSLSEADFAAMKNRTASRLQDGAGDGMTVYNAFGGYNDPAGAAQKLRQLGVPGVRYLDGGSRGVGQGSSNFVVFPGEENLLSILERNGQPLR